MHLKRVELYGFKSFADEAELELSSGITAIVGPNGSGKSNVADAIRWALGEQSARTLRGTRMEDVIFAGSGTRRPLGVAEVTLVFDNADAYLPLDYSEIAVTRRVYRSGESDFLICGIPCRLKDIHALFMDTGLGRAGYSVIEQGKIDGILAAGSGERRAFLEEAAGVYRYKTRRGEAARRLATADENATRIRDVVAELTRQIEPLERKAEEAKRFQECKEEATRLEIGLMLAELDEFETRRSKLSSSMAGLDARLRELKDACASLEAEVETDRGELARLDEVREDVQARAVELAAEVEKADGRIGIASERLKNHREQLESLKASIGKDRDKLSAAGKETAAKKARLSRILLEIETASQDLETLHAQDQAHCEEQRQLREAEEKLKTEIVEVLARAAEAKNDLSKMAFEDESRERQLKRQKSELEFALQDLGEIEAQVEAGTAQRAMLDARGAKLAEELGRLEKALESARKDLRQLNERQREIATTMHEKSLELDACQRMALDGLGYPEGTRSVLAAARRGLLEGIVGTLADSITVPSEYELAIENALGQALFDVIVDTDAHARAAVKHLKERDMGRATFLPLDLVRPSKIDLSRSGAMSMEGVYGLGSELVSFDTSCSKAVEYALGRTIVVRDLDVAVQVARATGRRFKIATTGGDLIFPGGAISGGSRRARSGPRLLQLPRKLEALRGVLQELRDEGSQIAETIQATQGCIEGLERQRASTNSESETIQIELAKLDAAQAENLRELERARRRLKMIQDELALKESDIPLEGDARRRLEERYEELTSAAQELEKAQASIASDLRELERLREEVLGVITELKVRSAALAQEASGLREQLVALEESVGDLAMEIDAKEAEAARVLFLSHEADGELETWRARLKAFHEEKARLDEALGSTRKKRQDLARRIAQKESRLRLHQGELGDIEKEKSSLNLEDVGLQERIRHLSSELARVHGSTIEEAKQRYPRMLDRAESVRRINLLSEEMDAIGAVDLSVIEVYGAMRSRQDYLRAGLEDLDRAARLLEEVMERSDCESERRFRETFDAVRQKFGRTFERLFGGGAADLVLVDREEALPPGVDIVAQPPGKKLQSLALLSAGERALAAIALVFAILEVRPSPCCVLDEIDAALDEANVGRFAGLLKDAAARGQFIVVTHRKGTMETADTLYGVTMEESGISKLISVRLEEQAGRRQEIA